MSTNQTNQIELTQSKPNIDESVLIDENQSSDNNRSRGASYRPDIDGLRAIAIAIVVIFHAFPEFMPGGFIGVDIFFVISGFLISSIIINQTQKGKFTYQDFYSRRIRRIYPALIIVMLTVLIIGCKKLMQRPLEIMTKTLTASAFFGANVQILTYDKDYFDPDVKTNPLLHLWSLGVEEQFYIIWPWFITLLITRFNNKAFLLLSIFTTLSFVFSIISVFINTKFAFYFPFCRFWQMAVGGLIAYKNINISNKTINNIMSLASIGIIQISVWILDEKSLFPGFWALIPTIGSACIIQAGNDSFFNKQVLSSKLFVWLGKISYSLYLWHWPLLVFSRVLYPSGSTSLLANPLVIVTIAILLSFVTYFFVQNPFRSTKSTTIIMLLTIVMISIGVSSNFIYHEASFLSQRFKPQIKVELQSIYQREIIPGQDDFVVIKGRKIPNASKNRNRKPPTIEKLKLSGRWMERFESMNEEVLQKKVDESSKYYNGGTTHLHRFDVANQGKDNQLFIIGDSHSRYIAYRFQKLFQESMAKNQTDTFPTVLFIMRQQSTFKKCEPYYNFTMDLIRKHLPKRVFFVYRFVDFWKMKDGFHKHTGGSSPKTEQFFQENIDEFGQTIKELQNLGVQVFVNGLSLQGMQFNPHMMADEDGIIEKNIQPVRLSHFRNQHAGYFDRFQKLMSNLNVTVINFSDHICWQDICQVLTPTGYSLYIDDNHQNRLFASNWAWTVDFLTEF